MHTVMSIMAARPSRRVPTSKLMPATVNQVVVRTIGGTDSCSPEACSPSVVAACSAVVTAPLSDAEGSMVAISAADISDMAPDSDEAMASVPEVMVSPDSVVVALISPMMLGPVCGVSPLAATTSAASFAPVGGLLTRLIH